MKLKIDEIKYLKIDRFIFSKDFKFFFLPNLIKIPKMEIISRNLNLLNSVFCKSTFFPQVIFSISLCYFATETPFDLNLHIVGDIDAGMRAPFLPDFNKTGQIIFSAFSIAIVSFVIHIALAKLIAKEYKYQINVNQVLNIFGRDRNYPSIHSIQFTFSLTVSPYNISN